MDGQKTFMARTTMISKFQMLDGNTMSPLKDRSLNIMQTESEKIPPECISYNYATRGYKAKTYKSNGLI